MCRRQRDGDPHCIINLSLFIYSLIFGAGGNGPLIEWYIIEGSLTDNTTAGEQTNVDKKSDVVVGLHDEIGLKL